MRRARVVVLGALALAAGVAQTPPFAADSARGAALFGSLSCAQCHAVNGRGGGTAPDLGRLSDRNFTPSALAATMWNHAPAMWSAMGAANVRIPDVGEQAAADLFAYFYAARFFEKPGDAARGKRLFADRGCAGCHGLTAELRPGAPPVSRWENLNYPLALNEVMWNHMPGMLRAMQANHAAWPALNGQDLTDLLVYLRNLPAARSFEPRFDVTRGEQGPALFQAKGCAACHGSGDRLAGLAVRISGRTLTDIAAAMWNHAPRMAVLDAPPAVFQPGEMRELLSYLWARQFFEDARDPVRGRRVFVAKRCAGCHDTGAAPKLPAPGRRYSSPAMVAALWHHGPAMLGTMKARGVAWPRLDGADISGLIAYLNLANKEKP
jgi:mono/diheme cytochrome c family protein